MKRKNKNLEKIIIQRAKNGNQLAFKWLFERNVDSIYNFMCQFSIKNAEVEDWVQRGFINSFSKISQFNYKSSFKTWLFSITINEMKMDLRKVSNIVFESDYEIADEIDEQEFEWKIDLKNELNKLDEIRKSVFILFEVEGFSHQEIAKMLNISSSSSRVILSRTKKYLREKLAE